MFTWPGFIHLRQAIHINIILIVIFLKTAYLYIKYKMINPKWKKKRPCLSVYIKSSNIIQMTELKQDTAL